ncbi:MAG: molybdopterin-dependent oxidoreductase [Anaerolineae bacterium]|nr:molybdopterin-dependent oxidoreductase [Anaerolineae bacterium]
MNQKHILKRPLDHTVSRRSFLKWNAVIGGTAVLAGMGLKMGRLVTLAAPSAPPTATEGQWVTAACWHNCGGRCLLKAYVVDGVVQRLKTDDTHPDSPDFPQQRACQRGRANRMQVLGPDRLKYPMKRAHWTPGGGDKSLRGRDTWLRISWDEALNLVAGEIKRIKESYGNGAILGEVNAGMERTLALYGGYATSWGSTSWGTWPDVGPAMAGPYGDSYSNTGNDRLRLRQSKLIIVWGANPAWTSGGNPAYNYLQAKKAGAKFIFIDPFYNESAQVLADEWIPIRPATDIALLLGMAYVMITEDSKTNPLIDWDFLNRCTVGFDKDHMPAGADPKANFRDYVLGTYDGKPKDPRWASEICGVLPEKIHELAIEYATTHPTTIINGGTTTRVHRAEDTAQAFMTLACMAGNIGLPGAGVGLSVHNRGGNAGPSLVTSGGTGVQALKNNIDIRLNQNELWDAVLSGHYTAGKGDSRKVDIRMVYYDARSTLNQKPGATKGIRAHREKLEFVVAQAYALTTQAKFADIILPVTTPWEKEGGFLTGNREILIFYSKVTEPLFEARDDLWIAKEIGKRLGVDVAQIDPISDKQKIFNQLMGAKVMKPDGSGMETLVTITDSDIKEWGVQGKPQPGRISVADFKARGVYQVERKPGDRLGFTEFEKFRQDPAAAPRETPSKKIEIHCKTLADKITAYGWTVKSPLPVYQRIEEGYEDTFYDWDNKVKGDYPLQMYTIHYRRRAHSNFDNVSWLREAFHQPVIMNPTDAEARGIQDGEVVKVSSRHGTVLRPVYLTNRMMPGVVTLGEGAWIELDEATGYDTAGNTNILNGGIPTGQGHAGWNSCNVEVEKYYGTQLADHKWPQRIL